MKLRLVTSMDRSFVVGSLTRRLGEVARIRRRLVLAGRHQLAVGTQEIVLVRDLDPRIVLRTHGGAPERAVAHDPLGLLGDRPGPRHGAIDYGDVVVEDFLVVLV